MSVQFVPRSTWGGTPTSNSGTVRLPLAFPVPTITVHYTGSPKIARASTWSAKDFMPDFQRIALASGKSFEYNYVIPPRSDGSAQVWEYAGTYQAAHSAGENAVAIGVLMCIGVDNHPSYKTYDPTKATVWEPLSDGMVEAYRWLRDEHLKHIGAVAVPAQTPHRNMPDANTACPGNAVLARWGDLLEPYQPALPPPPAPEDDHQMIRMRIDGYADQMLLVPIANVEALRKMGLEAAPLHVMTPASTRDELERDLGYTLTPLAGG